MRRWATAILSVVMAAAAAPPLSAQAAPPAQAAQAAQAAQGGHAGHGQPQDEAVIKDVVRRYVDAREKSDPKALEALFTPDADQLTSSGEWRRGRAELVKGGLASSARTGGTRSITVETVRFPAPGVALADGRYEIAAMPGGESRRMWTSFVMVHEKTGWRIASIRNMLPATQAAAAAPAAGR